ncbi:MAG TPA: HD domain-containing protein [Kofleriaceae bacterium]|nr:HD domain-containing protein [Kofleriaceae bacterium]
MVLIEIGAAIANGGGSWPDDTVLGAAQELAPTLEHASRDRVKAAVEDVLMGRDVDLALEWLMQSQVLGVLFPELVATVNLVQEPGRQHKDVWAHTKQVVKQTVRRPLVRWAALLHDIGKVPTRTYTTNGVHFHGHAWVGAKMYDKISQRMPFARDERQTIRFLINHHLRTNQYSEHWTDSAVRRFHREMGPHLRDLLDLSRADITSKRPGRRKQLLEQISALAERAVLLAEEDAKLPPLPGGVGNAIMTAFALPPSRLIGDLKRSLEDSVARGELEPRREDAYYVAHLARQRLVPGADEALLERLIAEGGLDEAGADEARRAEEAGAMEGPHRGIEEDDHDGDPERPRPGVLACGHDPHNDPCVHRDADPGDAVYEDS